jgi:hypothetical protein
VVELLNDQGRVIGNAVNVPMLGRFGFRDWDTILIERGNIQQFTFTVKADDISDQMSLRLTATADPAPNNNIVQVMTFAELKAARPDLKLTTPELLTPPVYLIGDRGPAGGIVFMVPNSGGNYMEVSPRDLGKVQWGQVWVVGTNDYDGKRNTEIIIAALKKEKITGRTAAQLCVEYTLNGYNDWFLPSRSQLSWMYENLEKKGLLGGFSKEDYYWSSTRDPNSLHAYVRAFTSNPWRTELPMHEPQQVRAVRYF